jgi:hypothetical protein
MTARTIAAATARTGGFFWLPCPLCGRHFGGHEWQDINSHDASIPDPDREQNPERALCGKAICPACTATGAGCRAWAAIGVQVHLDCPAISKENDDRAEAPNRRTMKYDRPA